MNPQEVIEKLKVAEIFGKGGAAFPTWKKWEGVYNATTEDKKYIIVCCGQIKKQRLIISILHI